MGPCLMMSEFAFDKEGSSSKQYVNCQDVVLIDRSRHLQALLERPIIAVACINVLPFRDRF